MHNFLIYLNIALTVIPITLYVRSTLQGKTKPHIFSWILWGLVNTIATLMQLQHGAGWGALTLGLGAISCIFVICVAFKHGEKHITRLDQASFVVGLAIIPLWLWAGQDILAMALSASIDMISFIPTVRKTFQKPYEENTLPYLTTVLCFLISIFLTEEKSLINLLYPVLIGSVNFLFIIYIFIRRKIITK